MDYTEQGAYFVTICTEGRRRLFGEVMDGAMIPNSLGWIVDDEWRRIAGFKAAVTSRSRAVLNDPHGAIWQRNYHERIIRSLRHLETVRRYISNNPSKWRSPGRILREPDVTDHIDAAA